MGVHQILWVKKLIFHVFGGHFDVLKLINNWYKTQLTSLKKNLSEIRPFTITSNRIFRNHSDFLFLTKVSGYLPNRVRFFQKLFSSSEQYFHGMNYRENPNFINFFFSFFLSFNLSRKSQVSYFSCNNDNCITLNTFRVRCQKRN